MNCTNLIESKKFLRIKFINYNLFPHFQNVEFAALGKGIKSYSLTNNNSLQNYL